MTKLIGTFAAIVGTLGAVFSLYYLIPQGLWLDLLLLCLSVQLIIMSIRSAIK
jgi:hypothetical protein